MLTAAIVLLVPGLLVGVVFGAAMVHARRTGLERARAAAVCTAERCTMSPWTAGQGKPAPLPLRTTL